MVLRKKNVYIKIFTSVHNLFTFCYNELVSQYILYIKISHVL